MVTGEHALNNYWICFIVNRCDFPGYVVLQLIECSIQFVLRNVNKG
jgi:hypothetical protein